MKSQSEGGCIGNYSSIYAVLVHNFTLYKNIRITEYVEYAVIKADLTNLTRYMASDLDEHDIRVSAVNLGGVFEEQDETFVECYERKSRLDGLLIRKKISMR